MQSEKLQTWALIAEVVGGLAVVVTLIFVGLEMRANTNAIQAQTYQELMRDINAWRASLREDELNGFTAMARTKEGFESLSENQLSYVRLIQLEVWGIYEAAFFANERGVLGEIEWNRFEYQICASRNSTVSAEFWDTRVANLMPFSELFTNEFIEYIDRECSPERN